MSINIRDTVSEQTRRSADQKRLAPFQMSKSSYYSKRSKRVRARLNAVSLIDLEDPAESHVEVHRVRTAQCIVAEIAERGGRIWSEGRWIHKLHACCRAIVANRIASRVICQRLVGSVIVEEGKRGRRRADSKPDQRVARSSPCARSTSRRGCPCRP